MSEENDVQLARLSANPNREVFFMGMLILLSFVVVLTVVLYGGYEVITGGIILKDSSASVAVSGLTGSIVGYFASNAQQVVGFYYGSSKDTEKSKISL